MTSQNPAWVSLSVTSPAPGGVSVGLLEDRAHQGGDHVPVALGAARGQVGHEVGAAALPGGLGEDLGDGRLDAPVGVGDHELDATEPAGHQGAQKGRPGGRVLGRRDVKADDHALTLFADGGGDHGRHVHHAAPWTRRSPRQPQANSPVRCVEGLLVRVSQSCRSVPPSRRSAGTADPTRSSPPV